MSMQIKSIILYNKDGDVRVLRFKLGHVNIITGKSSTGKSALIDIVEYCSGRSTFNIPEGVIRDTVSWYGVVYQINDTQVLVAKPAPAPNRISQSQVYYEVGRELSAPAFEKLVPNSNDDAVVEALSALIGISPNLNIPDEGTSRGPLEATLKHASFYLYQEQSVIASKHVLFHRQMEDYMPQAIKDTLPYFLGVVREDQLKLEQEARSARRDLKIVERELTELEYISSKKARKGETLIAEAQQVGIIPEDFVPKDADDVISALKRVLKWRPRESTPVVDDRIPKLRRDLYELRQEFSIKQEQTEAAESFAREEAGYSNEATEQLMRLESINLFSETNSTSKLCPLCSSIMKQTTPSAFKINQNLKSLENNLKTVQREKPRLRKHIQKLKEEREAIRNEIKQKELDIEALLREKDAAKRIRDASACIARVVGRISLYLESITFKDETSDMKQKINKLKKRVLYYEELLDEGEVEDIKISILNRIGQHMTQLARKLDLEHSIHPYRFDLNKLTVIADRPERPIPMERIGGAENWLGCHLIAHLGLHHHFVKRKRPVPNFLILDQPTQVYFPSLDKYRAMQGKTDELKTADADIVAVERMFDLLFNICKQLSPHFQIIILEHANLDQTKFQNSLVEEPWTEGRALIPESWLANQ